MSLAVCSMTLVSCGDDEPDSNIQEQKDEGKDKRPGEDAEKNTTDVAVTGAVSEVGAMWAQISGVVNLDVITTSYTNVTIGVEISTTDDFKTKVRTTATDVIGRKFSIRVRLIKPGMKYFYRTFVSISSLSYDYYGKTFSFIIEEMPSVNGHYYVDLGLPSGTLWAICNVGAFSPEEYGVYFAWGETEGYNIKKTKFDWDNYKWCKGSARKMTKYCTKSSYGYNGFTDNKIELDPEDDAAYINWDSNWRMPSCEQYAELFNNGYTTTEWTTQYGVNGRLITSLTNGNSIFLPAAGCSYGTSLSGVGSYGDYWSSALNVSDPDGARGLHLESSKVYVFDNGYRYCGRSIRPVRASK